MLLHVLVSIERNVCWVFPGHCHTKFWLLEGFCDFGAFSIEVGHIFYNFWLLWQYVIHLGVCTCKTPKYAPWSSSSLGAFSWLQNRAYHHASYCADDGRIPGVSVWEARARHHDRHELIRRGPSWGRHQDLLVTLWVVIQRLWLRSCLADSCAMTIDGSWPWIEIKLLCRRVNLIVGLVCYLMEEPGSDGAKSLR